MTLVEIPGSFEGSELGLCRGAPPALFFPERGASTAEAKATCALCPIIGACLEWALDNGEKHGIWGGRSERERRRMRRARRQAGDPGGRAGPPAA